jgi:hypothetical protein
MSDSRHGAPSSRRRFLKTAAGVAVGTALSRQSPSAQTGRATSASATGLHPALAKIHAPFMMTPEQAWDWHVFKGKCGPTYTGSRGWTRYTDFLISKLPEYGAVDLDSLDVSYDQYVVDDWPDRRTHIYDSGVAVEKLVTDGTPVPVVASYGMTSGFTPPEGITAQMLYYDPARPPSDAEIAGKILVFQTAPYPDPPYANSFLERGAVSDYAWRSPGKWPAPYVRPPTSVMTSYYFRYVWSQVGRFAAIGLKGRAAGMVIVYDLSPGAAFGLLQRSVFTADGRAGAQVTYINCPTLTLDRVNGAKVLADAKAGKLANLTLIARFERVSGKMFIAYLPGKHYGTPQDERLLLASHTDAMSLIEENGAFGLLGIMSYFNRLPRSARPRTLAFYFDCRHFMPGGERSWPTDYLSTHPESMKGVVATLGMEHMGGRQTIEVGPGGNDYIYSKELPENGGVTTSLIDVYNNNIWLVDAIARAAIDNRWPRVDVKSRDVEPGVNGGFQGTVLCPMMKGRDYKIPGIGLAGDYPGAWCQSYSQVDTEAGLRGFDKNYFVQQVAGLTQLTGDLMTVRPLVIDLGWGDLKSALVKLQDSGFVAPKDAAASRQKLVSQYITAFTHVAAADVDQARSTLKDLAVKISALVVPDKQDALNLLVQGQLAKIV